MFESLFKSVQLQTVLLYTARQIRCNTTLAINQQGPAIDADTLQKLTKLAAVRTNRMNQSEDSCAASFIADGKHSGLRSTKRKRSGSRCRSNLMSNREVKYGTVLLIISVELFEHAVASRCPHAMHDLASQVNLLHLVNELHGPRCCCTNGNMHVCMHVAFCVHQTMTALQTRHGQHSHQQVVLAVLAGWLYWHQICSLSHSCPL